MPVFVNDMQDRMPVDESLVDLLERVTETVLEQENADPEAEVSIALVSDRYIQELNSHYRHKDCPTDVLSFAMQEEIDEEPSMDDVGEEGEMLGDVVISLETAERQAAEFGHSFRREVAFLTVHGVLHLLGYDHETDADREVMRAREEAALERLKLTR